MLSFIRAAGTPYQVGEALGRFGAEAVHARLLRSDAWAGVMAWRGSEATAAMAALTQERFPEVWEEIRGLAAGLELPQDDVFLWNCRGDVWAMAPDGCTTVLSPASSAPDDPDAVVRISHNEDGDPCFIGHCAIAEVAPDAGARFASFVYPGSIPGHTFAVTRSGLAMTVNNIRARAVQPGVPRMVLARAILGQPNLAMAFELLQSSPRAGSFHLSLAKRGQGTLWSVEFGGHGVSVERVLSTMVHANHAVHPDMRDFPQIITESSRSRQRRGDAMVAAGKDALVILADRNDPALPIYRDAPDDSDAENTMATVDILVGRNAIAWKVYEKPGQPPRYSLIDDHLETGAA